MNKKVTRGSGLLEHFLARQRTQKANSLISEKSRQGKILDIGCGSYPYFLNTIKFNKKYGVDPSLINTDVKNMKLFKNDVAKSKLPFNNNYFDVVTMLAVFEHIDGSKLNKFLKEIFRVLKKNGIFIITTPSPWSDRLLHQMAKVGLISSEEIHDHKSHYDMKTILKIIRSSGFRDIKNGYFELWFNMWFACKK